MDRNQGLPTMGALAATQCSRTFCRPARRMPRCWISWRAIWSRRRQPPTSAEFSPIRRAHLAFVPSWPRSARRAAPEFFRWDLIRSGTSDQAFASAHLIGIASRGASQSRRASHYAPGGQARRPRWSRSPQAVLAKSSSRLTGMMFCVGIGRPACDPRCRASP